MKSYKELISQIPLDAWQFVQGEVDEDENGETVIHFYWDPEEHPELAPLSQISEEDWNEFVSEALQNAINETLDTDDNGTNAEGEPEPGDRNDGEGGELD